MIYSDYYKYVYYAPQRTGTSTIHKTLNKYYESQCLKGKHSMLRPPHTWDYFTFVSVRNPYLRFMSIYNFLIGRTLVLYGFERAINWWLPISKRLEGIRVDQLVRTESLEEDFKKLPFVDNLPSLVIPKLNVSKPFLIGVTKKQRDAIIKKFRRDFKEYNYDPDDCPLTLFNKFEECLNPQRGDIRKVYIAMAKYSNFKQWDS